MERLRANVLLAFKKLRLPSLDCLRDSSYTAAPVAEVSRRAFLKISAGAAFAFLPVFRLRDHSTGSVIASLIDEDVTPSRQSASLDKSWVLQLLRHEDLVNLRLEFFNLVPGKAKGRNIWELITGHKPYPPVLQRSDPTSPSFIVVHFPPQHIAEKAFFEDASEGTSNLPVRAVEARFSGESRLAFVVPQQIPQLDVTVANLLNWSQWEPNVTPTAAARGESTAEAIREPLGHETAIELPTRLLLSTNPYSGWAHSLQPGSKRDDSRKMTWTELWHTRLASKLPGQTILSESNDYFRTVRAVYSLDSKGASKAPPACQEAQEPPSNRGDEAGLEPMSERDRFEIVQLTSNFNGLRAGETGEPLDPQPIQVNRLFLTSQGAWIASQGDWEPADVVLGGHDGATTPPEGLSVRQWRQEASGGRDTFVRVVYGGFLYPYGHRANLIQVTERRIQRRNSSGPFKAFLRQRIFITVEDPVMKYGDAGVDVDGVSIDRQMPFVTIECTTASTPNLDRPLAGDLKYPCYFWPRVLKQLFQFHFRGLDNAGQSTEFTSPVIFFEYGQRRDAAAIGSVTKAFADSGEGRRPFGGQKLAFTPEHEPGDATMEAAFVHFSAYPAPVPPPSRASNDGDPSSRSIEIALAIGPNSASASPITGLLAGVTPQQAAPPAQGSASGVCCSNKPPRKPPHAPWKTHVPKAEVKVPALKGLAGTPNFDASIPIKWDPEYLKHGFTLDPGSANLGHVFAGIDGLKLPFTLPEVHSVSLFKPDFDIAGFSRKFGAIGGNLPQLKLGVFDPSSLFSGLSAKFLGALKLSDLLAKNLDFTSAGAKIVPPFKTRVIKDSSGIPQRVENYIDWEPQLASTPEGIVQVAVTNQTAAKMQVLVATQVKGGDSKQSLTGEIRNITVSIASAIDIEFRSLSFSSGDGQGTVVKVDPGKVTFRGGLAFVAALQDKFGSSLWGAQGPRITFEGGAVVARASFALPSVSFGIFSLRHLSLSPSLQLPLLGDLPLSVGVDFASRQDPFLVGVGILAGGGYLLLRFGGDGVQSIEFSIEAGALVALDLFVARGTAYVLVGVGMRYDRANQQDGLTLILFLKAGGSFDILGIITVSVQFTLTFEYSEGKREVTGTCTVTIGIDILFFHKDVSVTMTRTLNLGGGTDTHISLLEMPAFAEAQGPLPGSFQLPSGSVQPARFEELISEEAWSEYCSAFETFD